MRTYELLKKYAANETEIPESGWERLVWHAADMMKMAVDVRNTRKKSMKRKIKSVFVQEDLFSEGEL